MNWYRELGGTYENTKKFGRKVFVAIDKPLENELTRFSQDKRDVYCTPYMYKTQPQSSSEMYGPLYLDFDSDDYYKARVDLLITMSVLKTEFGLTSDNYNLYFSGSKGFHMVVSPIVLGIYPKKMLNNDYKKIAQYLNSKSIHKTIDTRIYDTVRLFRVVNTINGKSDLYKINITEKELRDLSFEEIKELAKSPRPENKALPIYNTTAVMKYNEIINYKEEKTIEEHARERQRETGELLPCIIGILEQGAQKGRRNDTTMILASALFQAKENLKEVTEVILEWNSYNEEPLSEDEIRTTIMSAYRYSRAGKGYGCTTIRELGYCLQGCPINRGN